MEGRCQCGQIKFTTPTSKPKSLYICHCTICRHQSASAFGITAAFPAFEVLAPFQGAIGVYSRPDKNGETRCYFCTKCGVRLYHQSFSHAGEPAATVAVKGGCLDGLTKEMMKDAFHIYTKSAIVDIPEGAKAYEEDDE